MPVGEGVAARLAVVLPVLLSLPEALALEPELRVAVGLLLLLPVALLLSLGAAEGWALGEELALLALLALQPSTALPALPAATATALESAEPPTCSWASTAALPPPEAEALALRDAEAEQLKEAELWLQASTVQPPSLPLPLPLPLPPPAAGKPLSSRAPQEAEAQKELPLSCSRPLLGEKRAAASSGGA